MYLQKREAAIVILITYLISCIFVGLGMIDKATSLDDVMGKALMLALPIAITALFLMRALDESHIVRALEIACDDEKKFGILVVTHGSHAQVFSYLSASLLRLFTDRETLQSKVQRTPQDVQELEDIEACIAVAKNWLHRCVSIAKGHDYTLPEEWQYCELVLSNERVHMIIAGLALPQDAKTD